ncbi:hypothetical protein LS684_18815 [Cytobacillus spongiae]|uniref:hypothetical protein n=1 Tax=Cytobacillus spongiae TaxID=2901381 RepID=UPI001F37E321|nr:hypothetical protein [Cytobacillus spongiae]UII55653.1 hypothetical protein LS684_18815 [Cytobacillus spongiae]
MRYGSSNNLKKAKKKHLAIKAIGMGALSVMLFGQPLQSFAVGDDTTSITTENTTPNSSGDTTTDANHTEETTNPSESTSPAEGTTNSSEQTSPTEETTNPSEPTSPTEEVTSPTDSMEEILLPPTLREVSTEITLSTLRSMYQGKEVILYDPLNQVMDLTEDTLIEDGQSFTVDGDRYILVITINGGDTSGGTLSTPPTPPSDGNSVTPSTSPSDGNSVTPSTPPSDGNSVTPPTNIDAIQTPTTPKTPDEVKEEVKDIKGQAKQKKDQVKEEVKDGQSATKKAEETIKNLNELNIKGKITKDVVIEAVAVLEVTSEKLKAEKQYNAVIEQVAETVRVLEGAVDNSVIEMFVKENILSSSSVYKMIEHLKLSDANTAVLEKLASEYKQVETKVIDESKKIFEIKANKNYDRAIANVAITVAELVEKEVNPINVKAFVKKNLTSSASVERVLETLDLNSEVAQEIEKLSEQIKVSESMMILSKQAVMQLLAKKQYGPAINEVTIATKELIQNDTHPAAITLFIKQTLASSTSVERVIKQSGAKGETYIALKELLANYKEAGK